ncbi:MAG TPA: hypothetical protein VIY28_09245 [Pseudonocardiaceae bacterium]
MVRSNPQAQRRGTRSGRGGPGTGDEVALYEVGDPFGLAQLELRFLAAASLPAGRGMAG